MNERTGRADTGKAVRSAGPGLSRRDPRFAFTDGSPFALVMVEGVEHVVRYANAAFGRLVGLPEVTMLGARLPTVYPRWEDCRALLAEVERTGVPQSQTETEREGHGADSQPGYVSYCAWPVKVDAEAGRGPCSMIQVTETSELHRQAMAMNEALLVSAMRQSVLTEASDVLNVQLLSEIADRKRSESALDASESRLRMALESAKASTWEWDVETNRLRWSDEIRALPGLKMNSREASFEAWRSMIHPEDQAAVDGLLEQAAHCSPQINFEFRVQENGGTQWMLVRGRLGRVDGDRALSYLGIVLDVTERKNAEQALLRSEKLAGAGRLAATLAHEINNPLDAAMNALYLGKTNLDDTAMAREYLAMADEELGRVAHMTRQSLGFYREATMPSTFRVRTLLDSVLGLLKNRFTAKAVEVETRCEPGLEMTGVFGEVRQVLVNLLANSLDAMDERGKIDLRAAASGLLMDGRRGIRVTVADSGRGMNALQLTHIFEPFFTTKGELGTGLGLWVTKQIVEKHGGTIRVRSSTGQGHPGTIFSIRLPG